MPESYHFINGILCRFDENGKLISDNGRLVQPAEIAKPDPLWIEYDPNT